MLPIVVLAIISKTEKACMTNSKIKNIYINIYYNTLHVSWDAPHGFPTLSWSGGPNLSSNVFASTYSNNSTLPCSSFFEHYIKSK